MNNARLKRKKLMIKPVKATVFSHLIDFLKEKGFGNNQNDIGKHLKIQQPNIAKYLKEDPQKAKWLKLFKTVFELGEKQGITVITNQLLSEVEKTYDLKGQKDLASLLGFKQPQISNWKNGKSVISAKSLKKILSSHTSKIFKPIIEFYECHPEKKGVNWVIDKNDKKIQPLLQNKIGVYAFYDSSGRIVYFGKSNSNLFIEICQRFKGKVNRHVRLPDKSSHIVQGNITRYISAVEVLVPEAIKNIESFVLRTIPNDDANSNIGNYQ